MPQPGLGRGSLFSTTGAVPVTRIKRAPASEMEFLYSAFLYAIKEDRPMGRSSYFRQAGYLGLLIFLELPFPGTAQANRSRFKDLHEPAILTDGG